MTDFIVQSTPQPTMVPPTGGGFWGFMFWNQGWTVNTRTSPNGASANQVLAYLFYIPVIVTISQVSYDISTPQAASTGDLGIYTQTGNLVVNTGGFATTAGGAGTGATSALTQGRTTLLPGFYYFAQTNTTTTVLQTAWQIQVTNDYLAILNNRGAHNGVFVIAGNSATSGVLPSTLGTLTNQSISGGQINPTLAWFCN